MQSFYSEEPRSLDLLPNWCNCEEWKQDYPPLENSPCWGKTTGFSFLLPWQLLRMPRLLPRIPGLYGSSSLNWTSPTSTTMEIRTPDLSMSSPTTEEATCSGPKTRPLVIFALWRRTRTSARQHFKIARIPELGRSWTLSEGSKCDRELISPAETTPASTMWMSKLEKKLHCVSWRFLS